MADICAEQARPRLAPTLMLEGTRATKYSTLVVPMCIQITTPSMFEIPYEMMTTALLCPWDLFASSSKAIVLLETEMNRST